MPSARPDRRSADRFPITRDVVIRPIGTVRDGVAGQTINISSNGVLVSTEQPLAVGERLQVAISWPAQLENGCNLNLIANGRVVRQVDGQVAIEIQQYEFRTAGRKRPAAPATQRKD